jgi:hypothetical protein
MFWIFDFVIFSWLTITYFDSDQSEDPPFHKLAPYFFGLNTVLAGAVAGMFVWLGEAAEEDKQRVGMYGSLLMASTMVVLAVGFVAVGRGLMKKLNQDFVNKYAARLFKFALGFCVCLVLQSVWNFVVVGALEVFTDNFAAFQSTYLALEVCGLSLVLLMFRDVTNKHLKHIVHLKHFDIRKHQGPNKHQDHHKHVAGQDSERTQRTLRATGKQRNKKLPHSASNKQTHKTNRLARAPAPAGSTSTDGSVSSRAAVSISEGTVSFRNPGLCNFWAAEASTSQVRPMHATAACYCC